MAATQTIAVVPPAQLAAEIGDTFFAMPSPSNTELKGVCHPAGVALRDLLRCFGVKAPSQPPCFVHFAPDGRRYMAALIGELVDGVQRLPGIGIKREKCTAVKRLRAFRRVLEGEQTE